jgi:hypothetical protein
MFTGKHFCARKTVFTGKHCFAQNPKNVGKSSLLTFQFFWLFNKMFNKIIKRTRNRQNAAIAALPLSILPHFVALPHFPAFLNKYFATLDLFYKDCSLSQDQASPLESWQ